VDGHGAVASVAAPHQGGSGNVFAVPYIQFSKIIEAVKIPPHFLCQKNEGVHEKLLRKF
jgi:hypothetical protein